MKQSILVLTLCAIPSLGFSADLKNKKSLVQLPAITVIANAESSLTVPSNSQAREEINQTPGSVAVVDSKTFENKYSLNLQDTLAYVPGVYTQKRFGEEVRISVRGSGLSRGFHMRGLELLQDGVPFNLADGSADFQEADTLAFQRLEVFKGSNALKFGGSTLGGAVNMVSKTGKTNPGGQVRLEVGSFDTKRFNVQSGRDFGDSDMFISLTGTSSGGYRGHSAQENLKLNGNFGKKIGETAETRFYLSANSIEQELPGTLGRSDALNNPTIANATAISGDQKRDIRSVRTSNKTSFVLDDGDKVDLGAFLNVKDLSHPISIFIDQKTVDYGIFTQRSGEYNLANHRNTFLLGVRTHFGKTDAKVFQNIGGTKGAQTSNSDQSSKNATIYGENHFFLTQKLSLVTGLQLAWSKREDDNYSAVQESDEKIYRSLNPKIGMLYEAAKDIQFFANVSKSNEPPTFSELTQSGTVGFTPLDMQKAWTAEIGTRGNRGIVEWDVSLYRSWIRNEMLQYTVGSGIPASTFNAQDTVHQGIEIGLNLKIAENIFSSTDKLKLNNAYTLSDYRFDHDRQYGNNIIAGQPRHFLRSELHYGQPAWFVAPNIEVASSAQVDFSNTVQSPGYTILGFTAGYNLSQNVSFYLDGRNLLDKNYIATFSTAVSGAGNVFYPGDGRAFYAGVKIKL
jgi:iron complex outermembrane receptor protein